MIFSILTVLFLTDKFLEFEMLGRKVFTVLFLFLDLFIYFRAHVPLEWGEGQSENLKADSHLNPGPHTVPIPQLMRSQPKWKPRV